MIEDSKLFTILYTIFTHGSVLSVFLIPKMFRKWCLIHMCSHRHTWHWCIVQGGQWNVTTPAEEHVLCYIMHHASCGPNVEFDTSLPGQNGECTLNVSDDFRVECRDQAQSIIGSETICIVCDSVQCRHSPHNVFSYFHSFLPTRMKSWSFINSATCAMNNIICFLCKVIVRF